MKRGVPGWRPVGGIGEEEGVGCFLIEERGRWEKQMRGVAPQPRRALSPAPNHPKQEPRRSGGVSAGLRPPLADNTGLAVAPQRPTQARDVG
ncbi:hypothetical protein AAFF_G00341600 [Aldrovandia affinis]|uniref:Uncharacterized protein n=1 Tax=Aldrovandia affinis TaxID=143900 RepID=A0AAD7SKN2_9TELE|nr:hypothetical protein AAFF_G00341600 [Aldrovandia affinis]